MSKQHNMGRKSHMAIDGELEQAQKGMEQDLPTAQPARPTVHPDKPARTSGDLPPQRHSRRGN